MVVYATIMLNIVLNILQKIISISSQFSINSMFTQYWKWLQVLMQEMSIYVHHLCIFPGAISFGITSNISGEKLGKYRWTENLLLLFG